MGAGSPEGHPHPGLHHKKLGQQCKEGDSNPLLRFGETPPVSRFEIPAQEGHGPVGAGPEEGHKKMLQELESLCYEDRLRELRLIVEDWVAEKGHVDIIQLAQQEHCTQLI